MNGVNYGDRNMEMILIEDCCEILDSKRIPITAKNRTPGPYPYYGANGIQDYVDNYIFDDELVLLAEDGGNFGSTEKPIAYRVSGKCWVNNHAHVLKPRNGIDVDYLCYSLMFYDTNGLVNGATRQKLTQSTLKKMSIPKRTVKQQLQIVQELNTIKKLITARQQELQKLDDLIKARFVEMFGNGHDGFCNTKKLGEFCKFQQGTQIPVEEQIEEQLEGYTRFLRIIDYTQAPQIPRYVSVKGREIAEDSVVIVRYGATAGFVGHGYDGILANNLFEVVPDESILSKDFLYLALKYGTFEQEVHDKAFGAAMPALSFGMMNDIGVVTPNSTAQNGFVDFVKQVDKSKATVQKALDETQLLFDSLMQQYFG